jgi:hypothetical protein
MRDPVVVDKGTFQAIEEKCQHFTHADWRALERLIRYRGKLKTAIASLYKDLSTEALEELYTLVKDWEPNRR